MAEIQPVGSNQPYVNQPSGGKKAVKVALGAAALAAVAVTAFAAHNGDVFTKIKDVVSGTKGQKLGEKIKTIFTKEHFSKGVSALSDGFKAIPGKLSELLNKIKGTKAAEKAAETAEQVVQ